MRLRTIKITVRTQDSDIYWQKVAGSSVAVARVPATGQANKTWLQEYRAAARILSAGAVRAHPWEIYGGPWSHKPRQKESAQVHGFPGGTCLLRPKRRWGEANNGPEIMNSISSQLEYTLTTVPNQSYTQGFNRYIWICIIKSYRECYN